MAKTNTAVFAQNPRTVSAVVTAALGAITTDAPTGTVLLATAGADGSIVTRLSAMPRATVAATSLVLFTSNDAGVTQRMKASELMPTQAVGTSTKIVPTPFGDFSEARPLRLGANERLYVGAQIALAAGIVFNVELTDF